ncbi:hypothetical protein D3X12_18635 [Pseudomonas protegens]|uniref:DUF1534 domain-containing protein n=1 Tax=Pseudomonas protegens TaxID=380021 RepID=A0ABY2VMI8_9PSED|nr:hypothetical protein CEP86_32325 [Pseudomonas protegens]QEZ52575.1 hypothetical protein D3X12_18635 [Pseudomonas protegens]QEZ55372.1 hypothetical protein D4N38_00845 [Pseudomonas protegens]QEZ63839.1 hypothetical protein D4N37_13955 [Pseudomonas protegens]TMM66269.1 hypothetical protein FEF10_02065 [Pseudomonas protegens]
MPAKAATRAAQGSRPCSPASRLLPRQTYRRGRSCRSWLASEGGRKSSTRLKGLFAGKPAPTEEGVSPRMLM